MAASSTMARVRTAVAALVLAFLVLVPVYAYVSGDIFVLTLMGRILVFALCAIGLNLALGYGGLVSLGHAMYIGLGGYAVGILSTLGITNGWLHLGAALLVTLLVALPVGWVALRTQGIAFIMITLAFAQLAYYVFVSLKNFGGDDGISVQQLSEFGFLTANKYAVYASLMAVVLATLYAMNRLVQSRYGLVLRATMVNERRVNALGSPSLPYRLVAYVLSAEICAVGGFFLVNITGFVSPANMTWAISGELIVMVLLGGVGTVFGPVVGAVGFMLLEEGLKLLTEHWPLIMGPLIVLMVLFFKKGIWGLLAQPTEGKGAAGAQGGHA